MYCALQIEIIFCLELTKINLLDIMKIVVRHKDQIKKKSISEITMISIYNYMFVFIQTCNILLIDTYSNLVGFFRIVNYYLEPLRFTD